MIIILFILVMCITQGFCGESGLDVDMDTIALIESGNRDMAYNPRTKATGKYQITPICLEDFKMFANPPEEVQNWTMNDMFDGWKSGILAMWYLNERIPQMLRAYKIPDTLETRLIAYSWGIGNLKKFNDKYLGQKIENTLKYLPKETRNYIKKYRRLTK